MEMRVWDKAAPRQAIERAIAALNANGIEASLAANGMEARERVLSLLPSRGGGVHDDLHHARPDRACQPGQRVGEVPRGPPRPFQAGPEDPGAGDAQARRRPRFHGRAAPTPSRRTESCWWPP